MLAAHWDRAEVKTTPAAPRRAAHEPLPEGEGVVPDEGLALPDEEGAVGGPRLDAVLCQQPLGYVPPVAPRSQLAVKPLLRGVQLRAVAHLEGKRHRPGSPGAAPHGGL